MSVALTTARSGTRCLSGPFAIETEERRGAEILPRGNPVRRKTLDRRLTPGLKRSLIREAAQGV